MALGNAIILNSDFKGLIQAIKLSGATLPGTFMEIVPATAPVSGIWTFRAVSRANGAVGCVCILLSQWEEGGLATTSIASAQWAKIYWPLNGDELNAVVGESSGTGTSGQNLLGDTLSISDSGTLMAGTSTAKPFWLLDRTDLATYAAALKRVQYLGSYA